MEGSANDRLDFTFGVNYFHELARNGDGACRNRLEASGFADINQDMPVILNAMGNYVPNPALGDGSDVVDCTDVISGLYFDLLPGQFLPFINTSRIENESMGVFGHVSWALNDNWTLDFGARSTSDDREFWNMEAGIQDCGIEEANDADVENRRLGGPIAANGSMMCQFDWGVSFDSTVREGFYNSSADTFTAVTPMLSITRRLAPTGSLDSGMIYALYSEGFLTGGFNTEINSNLPGIAKFLSYGPESVANFELGFKGTLADGRVQIMADVFMMDYTDKQENISVPNDDAILGIDESLGILTNVSSGRHQRPRTGASGFALGQRVCLAGFGHAKQFVRQLRVSRSVESESDHRPVRRRDFRSYAGLDHERQH